jgi:hypothetical protein
MFLLCAQQLAPISQKQKTRPSRSRLDLGPKDGNATSCKRSSRAKGYGLGCGRSDSASDSSGGGEDQRGNV